MQRMRLVVAMTLLLAEVAIASPGPSSVVTLGAPLSTPDGRGRDTGRVRIRRLIRAADGKTVRVTLDLSSTQSETFFAEVSVPVLLAPGAHVTGMVATLGGHTCDAIELRRGAARKIYLDRVHDEIDPALLELVASSDATGDELNLSVWPVTRAQPARIELVITLPSREPVDWMTADPIPRGRVSAYAALVAVEPAAPRRAPPPVRVVAPPPPAPTPSWAESGIP